MLYKIFNSVIYLFLCNICALNILSASELSQKMKDEMHNLIEEYILGNPEIVLKALKLIETKQIVEQELREKILIKENKDIIFSQAGVFYDPEQHLVIVSFIDFNCSFCKKSDAVLSRAIEKNPDITYLVKNFPILGETSVLAARAAIFLKNNEERQTYLNFVNLMMSNPSKITLKTINSIARSSGSSLNITLDKLKSSDIDNTLNENFRLSDVLEISGTPTLLINNKLYRGHIEGDNLDEIIKTYRGEISKPQN